MRTRTRGFTLFELLITIAIIIIALSLAWPGMQPVIDSARTRSSVSEVNSAFRLARQTAVERGQIVTVCAIDEKGACGEDWNHAISVFLDPDNERALDSNEQLLRTVQTPDHTGFAARPAHMPYYQYDLMGEIRGATGGHVNVCPGNEDIAHARIVVGPSGRTRVIWEDPGTLGC